MRGMLVMAALIAVGTGTAVAATASAASTPKHLVLRLQDMPTGFKLHKAYAVPARRAAKEDNLKLKQLKRWGYVTGYEADYSRNVSLSDLVKGAVDIDSSVGLYKSTAGAHASMALSEKGCRKHPATELSVGAKIGDEALLCAFPYKSHGYKIETYVVLWRRGPFKAAVTTGGLKGGTSPQQAVSLARLQDRRMR